MAALVSARASPAPLPYYSRPKVGKRPVVSLSLRVPYELKEGQRRYFHELPSGLRMEVISLKGLGQKTPVRPPLVFLHGSFHAAWCWAPHWLPFFSDSGYDCYALSLLGQGESDVPTGTAAGTLQTHASDIADFIHKELGLPPVLIGHSFGGLIVQSYISSMAKQYVSDVPSSYEMDKRRPLLAGAVLVCSVPPSGNGGLVWRYLWSKPVAAFKVTVSLAAKGFANSLPLCKETFFSARMEDALVQRYQELMKESSKLSLFDLKKLNASLPPPSVPKDLVQVLVLGASNDFIVDTEGLQETAKFYGVSPVCIDGVAHDMMLDVAWEKGARATLSWLECLNQQKVIEFNF